MYLACEWMTRPVRTSESRSLHTVRAPDGPVHHLRVRHPIDPPCSDRQARSLDELGLTRFALPLILLQLCPAQLPEVGGQGHGIIVQLPLHQEDGQHSTLSF